MSLLPRDIRASDLDRERAVAFLRGHYADGRLGEDELDWRCDAAYRAVRLGELDGLTADLPALAAPPRRRSRLPLLLIALTLVALIVVVPPETTLAIFLVFTVLGLIALTLLSPLWIPVLLGVVVWRVVRAARRPAAPPHVGWR